MFIHNKKYNKINLIVYNKYNNYLVLYNITLIVILQTKIPYKKIKIFNFFLSFITDTNKLW